MNPPYFAEIAEQARVLTRGASRLPEGIKAVRAARSAALAIRQMVPPTLMIDAATAADIAMASEALQAALKADLEVVEPWVEREKVLGNPEAFVPTDWDVEADVVILLGPEDATREHAEGLASVGLKRICQFDPAQPVHILDEMLRQQFEFPHPRRVSIQPLAVTPTQMRPIIDQITATVEAGRAREMVASRFASMWLRHGLANLERIASSPPVSALAGLHAGATAFCVAPGPSLTRNLRELRAVEGKGIVIALSHAVAILQREGIRVDYAVIADPQPLAYHLDGVDFDRLGAVVAAWTVAPEVIAKVPAGKLVHYSANPVYDTWIASIFSFKDEVGLSAGGSVAHNAFDLALRLGCQRIVLVGQDLAFSATGQVYAERSADGEAEIEFAPDGQQYRWTKRGSGLQGLADAAPSHTRDVDKLVWAKAWSGSGEVPTSGHYAWFRIWFEERARDWKRKGLPHEFVNCTEGGSHVAGFDHRRLRDVVGECVALPRHAVVSWDAASSIKALKENRVATREAAMATWECAQRCIDSAEKGAMMHLEQADEELRVAVKPLEGMMMIWIHDDMSTAFELARYARSKDAAVRASLIFYRAVARMAGEIAAW